MKVAVTGANGFVSRILRNFLHENKINVLAISRKNFRKHVTEIKITSRNLLEPKLQSKLKNYDVIVHLVGIGRQSPDATFEEVNLNFIRYLLEVN